ncbi:integrase catalytic domain-containing protein [Trichonephila clavipes]|nr:integrase catalytic domain-containing protein [Trichonephila clavipes]
MRTYQKKTKHPILPKSHYITELIVRHYHHKYLHGGSELISALRMQYWIISARTVIRKVMRNCVDCFRHKSVFSQQLMGDLPVSRVNLDRAFFKSGVDFAGPFQVKPRRGRGVRALKTYACIVVCFIAKAIHLELVGDLTAKSFIAVLKRFIARRGRPEELYSDCGTNFIGACRELRKWASNEVTDYVANKGVTWKFNPPSSPHFGGLWEASMKSMKMHMKRAIGSQVLTYEEFSTYLAEIEACLNSRPLVPVSSYPEDCYHTSALLNRNFAKRNSRPNLCNKRISLYDPWKLLQQMTQSFWKRRSLDYLTQLRQCRKWQKRQYNLKVNDLVLIKKDNLPPFH